MASPSDPCRVTAIVRVSPRARRMRLLARPGQGLELVVPPHTAPAEMAAFLTRHAAWAARTLRTLGAPLDARDALPRELPARLPLRALHEDWRLVGVPGAARPGKLELRFRRTASELRIEIGHAAGEPPARSAAITLLRRYLRDRARHVLPPWIDHVVRATGLAPPPRVRIGMQRTVWGSRAADGTLALSARLLLLAPELVRHVIVHELCHTGHMHHGASFHRHLARHDPQAREHRRALRQASRALPAWLTE